MKMFLKHVAIRILRIVSSPVDLALLLVAGFGSLLLWPWLATPSHEAGVALGVIHKSLFVVLWPWLACVPIAGRGMCGGAAPKILTSWAFPALPLGKRTRLLGEATAVLVILTVARLPGFLFGEFGHVMLRPSTVLGAGAPYPLEFLAHSALLTVLLFPALLAWATPTRLVWLHLLRIGVAAAVPFAVIESGLIREPLWVVFTGIMLAGLMLSLANFEPEARPSSSFLRRPVRLHRTSRDPVSQFKRDLLLGPMPILLTVLAITFVVAATGLLLGHYAGVDVRTRAAFGGFSFGLLFVAFYYPFGINVLKGDQIAGSLMTGTYAASWRSLPVRREAVARGIYLYELGCGLGLLVLALIHHLVADRLGLADSDYYYWVLPLFLVVPSAAGFMLCTAVGDRRRGYVSLLAAILVIPVHIGTRVGFRAFGYPRNSIEGLATGLALLVLLAIIGGVPPLVHLRRNRKTRET
jgi:hypothetical protein